MGWTASYMPKGGKMSELTLEKCPSCPDERLVRMASAVGALVCPECDLVVLESRKQIEVILPPAPEAA